MIKILDPQSLVGNELGLIVPVTIYGKIEGGFDYDMFSDVYMEYNYLFRDKIKDYLKPSFFERMKDLVSPIALKYGYIPSEEHIFSYIDTFYSDKIINHHLDALKISSYDSLVDITESDFDLSEFPAFGHVIDNKIVSICGVNDYLSDDTVEISVATNNDYLKKGYALSSVISMNNYLVRKGLKAVYMCYSNNNASYGLAKKAKFKLISKDYYFVCYEKEQ